MLGRQYWNMENGRIYEIIGQDVDFETSCYWLLWNKKFGDLQAVTEAELVQQVGWDLVGKGEIFDPQKFPDREAPSATIH